MKRDLYIELLSWKLSKNRKPLIVRGARQVGKTYLLKEFGNKEFSSCLYLNFDANIELQDFFKSNLKPDSILEKLSIYFNVIIDPKNTLIFFDEIQECPQALNSLKYFQEDRSDIFIVAAGSLLGVALSNTKGFPVGKVDFLELHPLSFFEFLEAIDKCNLRELLEKWLVIKNIDEPFHKELISLFKKYLYIGGMPEAVKNYSDFKDLLKVRRVQDAILMAYKLDFAKHVPKEDLTKVLDVWDAIPQQLAKENKKFIFSVIKKSARGREYVAAIQWLIASGLIMKSTRTLTSKLPLQGYCDQDIYKVFLLDVGLLAAMCKIPQKSVIDKNNLLSEFYGAFTENYIAQELVALQFKNLYYWASNGTAEIDFIIEHELNIYPIEVKYGVSRRKKSLQVYKQKYNPLLLLRFSSMNLQQDANLINMPLYLIGNLNKYLNLV